MTIEENDVLINKAEEITNKIIETNGKTFETAEIIAKHLYAFGDDIVEKTEAQGSIGKNIKCSSGCNYCCYAQVSVTPPEAIVITNYLKENYSLSNIDKLLKNIKNNINLTENKTTEERIEVWEKTPCIFLVDKKCSVYEVRPFICRAWHSLSVEQCKTAFKSRDKDAEIDSYPYRNYILGAIREGLSKACEKAGCDSEPVEIAIAVKTLLDHPSPEEAWINGEKIF